MRQAVNYAIDRRALSRNPPPSWFGQPTDQSLPPGMTGFRDASIYPLQGPDVARARRLAGSRGGHVVMYTCNLPSCLAVAQVVRENLSAIGIAVEIRQFPYDTMYKRLWRPGEPWDIADTGWIAEYADPSEFLNVLYGPIKGPRVVQFVNAGNEDSFDLGRFGGPKLQRRLLAANKLTGPRRYRAYDRLDADLARNAAPLAAYATDEEKYFFSPRMGCQVVQPVSGLDLAALCTRP
jgi:ABC-type transport system substrate-binding protein